jgi:hypothetical protein
VQLLDVAEVGKLEVEVPAMVGVGDVVLGGESHSASERYHSAVAVATVSAR